MKLVHLYKPQKTSKNSSPFPFSNAPSHNFTHDSTYPKNKALDKLIKNIIRNMQWNKKS